MGSCACVGTDARMCYLMRDNLAICDDDDELELELDQNVCECVCHDEDDEETRTTPDA